MYVRQTIFACLATLIAGAIPAIAQSAASPPAAVSPQRALLNRYCVTCHNERLKTADMMLDKMDVDKVPQNAPVWEKVIRKLRTGAMPPSGMPRPDDDAKNVFATYLETEIDRAAAGKQMPGRPVAVHRLNRAEYSNAVRDLLALDINVESLLPPDKSGYGFDNVGDVLSVSPMLLDRYMSVAGQIRKLAIGDTKMHPSIEWYKNASFLLERGRMSEDLPFGTRGGIAAYHRFPVDGDYDMTIHMKMNTWGDIIGIQEPHQMAVWLDGVRLKQFTVGGQIKGNPGTDDSTGVTISKEADSDLHFRFAAKAGRRLVGIAYLNEPSDPTPIIRPAWGNVYFYQQPREGDPGIESFGVEGPYDVKGPGDTPSRRKIFVCQPTGSKDEDICARKILSNLARRAYRRPLTDADVQAILALYKTGRAKGFEAGVGLALEGILVSREFLFRTERDPPSVSPDTPYRLGDLELASRLSFFLWSSLPDQELLGLAERGKLRDPGVLEHQVRRMLADTRANALGDNFAGQWLEVRTLRSESAGREVVYPEWDENLREAFIREIELFFESMVKDDHSVVDLLNSNYTFVNDRLARHYGIPDVFGSRFRRVALTDEARMGLLGKGGILAVTAYANRTSPVLRGKWILENVLGTPPPPPPPNVPALKESTDNGRRLTMRQAMEQHRANPACATCHSRMDPLGFALENFDAVGMWRTTEGNVPIDSSGSLPDGTKFQGVAQLRKLLMAHPEQFVTVLTERLLTYALGRGVEYYDQPAIRKIMKEAAPNSYRWSSIIVGIVNSVPFQMRESAERLSTADLRNASKPAGQDPR